MSTWETVSHGQGQQEDIFRSMRSQNCLWALLLEQRSHQQACNGDKEVARPQGQQETRQHELTRSLAAHWHHPILLPGQDPSNPAHHMSKERARPPSLPPRPAQCSSAVSCCVLLQNPGQTPGHLQHFQMSRIQGALSVSQVLGHKGY